jgi:hypothetical protein
MPMHRKGAQQAAKLRRHFIEPEIVRRRGFA